MSNEKPVELTEAECAAIFEHAADYSRMLPIVSRIKAAARREALLEAAEKLDALPTYRVNGLIGYLRDYADGRDAEADRIADWLRALAEPERDEEGGR